VIYLISLVFTDFLSLTLVANAFKGIKIAVGLLIVNAGITMIKKMHKKAFSYAIMLTSFAVMVCVNIFSWCVSSVYIMLAAGLVSLVMSTISSAKAHNNEKEAEK